MLNWISERQWKRWYVQDQQGIMNRFLRETRSWQNHLEHTRQFILNQAQNKKPGRIAILGSGWLLDFPVEEMLRLGFHLSCFDIVHPKQVQYKYKNINQVSFINRDLTNGLIELAGQSVSIKSFIQGMFQVNNDFDFSAFDWVISLNVLNQLDILLIDFLERKIKKQEMDKMLIRRTIQDNHIKTLPVGKSSLITDWEEVLLNKNNEVDTELKSIPLIFSSRLDGYTFESWTWDFDTHQTYRKKINTRFIVRAYNF